MHLQDYDVEEKLSQSATSAVYRVGKKMSREKAVIKVLRGDHPSTARVKRFHREYEILQMFAEKRIETIINPLDLIFENHTWVMLLEDFGGISLANAGLIGCMDPASFLEIALQLTDMLESVHRHGIIHCDINPSNILINPETGEMKLIDFNIATPYSKMDTSYQHPNTLEGTLAYISPEQTGRMNRSIDFRSDYYSLGVTLYELAAGVRPFSSDDHLELVYSHIALDPPPPAAHNPELPAVISDIILKLMAKGAGDRYQSGSGLKADLSTCLAAVKEAKPVETFSLGEKDRSGTLQLSQKLGLVIRSANPV